MLFTKLHVIYEPLYNENAKKQLIRQESRRTQVNKVSISISKYYVLRAESDK